MFIIHETLSSQDPRLHPEIVRIGDYWHFTISYIPPNKGVFVDWMAHEKLTEDVARSFPLTNAYRGVVSLSKPFTKKDDIVTASGDVEWKKHIYKLTATDKDNVVKLIKAAARLYAKLYIKSEKTLKKLIKEIDNASTMEDCDILLYTYYNISTATTRNLEKKPKFQVEWPPELTWPAEKM